MADAPPTHTIDDVGELREHYRPPNPIMEGKAVPAVDATSARFIASAPLVVLATSGERGTDASPRGGPPGFVHVSDGGSRLAWADLAGNNRLDSFTNLLDDARVGLLFLVPGSDETVRVIGRAHLSTDGDLLDAVAIDGRRPKVAVVVEVDECMLHCGKALRRAGVWDPTTWPDDSADVPTAGEIVNDQHALGVDPQMIDDDLEAGYEATMWEPGGDEAD